MNKLSEKDQHPIAIIAKWVLSLIVVLGGSWFILKASSEWGAFKQELKNEREQLMFESSDQRVKTKMLVDAPYSKYQQLMARDTIKAQGKHLDTIQVALNKAFDTINKFWIADAEDKIHRMKSRNRRDSLDLIQTQQMEEFIKDGVIQKGINLQILDELKEIRKHHNDST